MDTRMREQFFPMQRNLRGPAWRSMSAQEFANLSLPNQPIAEPQGCSENENLKCLGEHQYVRR